MGTIITVTELSVICTALLQKVRPLQVICNSVYGSQSTYMYTTDGAMHFALLRRRLFGCFLYSNKKM